MGTYVLRLSQWNIQPSGICCQTNKPFVSSGIYGRVARNICQWIPAWYIPLTITIARYARHKRRGTVWLWPCLLRDGKQCVCMDVLVSVVAVGIVRISGGISLHIVVCTCVCCLSAYAKV